MRPGRPARLHIPSLGVHAPVVGIDLQGHVLTPPSDPAVIGWWRQGALPGARTGTAMLTGHTVHSGGGALDHLEQVARGAGVRVSTARGPVDYRVVRVQVLSKAALADRAQVLFSQERRGRLVLVTCENWNGYSYDSNVVVVATPVG